MLYIILSGVTSDKLRVATNGVVRKHPLCNTYIDTICLVLASAHHSQRSSDNTVPMKPFTNNKVHTRLVGGSSNDSMCVKCHIATTGRMIIPSISPTNPSDDKYTNYAMVLYYLITLTKEHWYLKAVFTAGFSF